MTTQSEQFFQEFKDSPLFDLVAERMNNGSTLRVALRDSMILFSDLYKKLDNKELDNRVMEEMFA